MFTTERLILRPYVESDLDDILRLWNDPVVQPFVTNDNVTVLGPKFKETLRTQMERATFGAIIALKETGEFMGQGLVDVQPKNRDGTFGICLLPKFWNNGYGTEATKFMIDHSFKWFGLNRLSLGVFANNARAIAVYEKLGFVIEGRKRQAVWMDNRWEDSLTMGILRDEWEKQH
ncbi:acyl-CoA N-acyltransferase [Suillus subaureus]|uniref:Acyl-CoA N-acyltransferase n=1 Tax=Suillus subaureus TaxID=48587 RepID=A0A9P7EIP9_9AGAM|nr:acyl-CoA N-acyltransferase [Suillus subaureus]KAG1822558.1 acyl-CoA N-acyltransferase [Suillus subaureus]